MATGRMSQRDIAKAAGVSQAAVSMVLNGKADEHGVAQATQERIQRVMDELGYVPDVAGRSLRSRRNDLIGVHTYEAVFPVSASDYYHDFLVGIEAAAVEASKDLVLFASTQRPDGTRTAYTSAGNRLRLADGTVILGLAQNSDELERLAGEGVPFVFIGRREVPRAPAPYVSADYAAAVREVLGWLTSAGHEVIGYLGVERRFGPLIERHDAFRRLAESGLWRIGWEGMLDPEAIGVSTVEEMVDAGVTALVVESADHLGALSRAAAAAGVVIPEQLSVAVLEMPRDGGVWSHIRLPKQEMGRASVRILLDLLDGRVGSDHHVILPCTFHELGTIGPPRAADPDSRGPA